MPDIEAFQYYISIPANEEDLTFAHEQQIQVSYYHLTISGAIILI